MSQSVAYPSDLLAVQGRGTYVAQPHGSQAQNNGEQNIRAHPESLSVPDEI